VSETDVQIVQALYAYSQTGGNLVEAWQDEEFTRAGLEALRQFADPEFEFVLVTGEAVGGDVFRGVEGLLSGMREWLSDWESYEVEPVEFIDLSSRVVVLTRERGVSRQGKVPMVQEGAVVYTFREGKLIRAETYLERASALSAVGIEP
jgi:ketosteroid isomerase-like protein